MSKFDYDDSVFIKPNSVFPERAKTLASVVGVFEDRKRWVFPEFPPGVIYTVEFDDGVAVEVHESHLSAWASRSDG
uniref:hypothetical protein n=1 Tax=Asticcacaulis sp. 201 TaxID=3028787 RepID=UPI002915CE46|nr:hypothetical protein [Asticcacaulis sp. 201]MDV6331327.1 hypothetical protein [Asticcacaulis sp. 201]